MTVAMLAIGTLLIFAFNSYVATLRYAPETKRLDSILNRIAAKAIELLTSAEENASIQVNMDMPTAIGNREYWIRLSNDTLRSWVEGGLGKSSGYSSDHQVFLPGNPSATGYYASGYGKATMRCSVSDSAVQLELETTG